MDDEVKVCDLTVLMGKHNKLEKLVHTASGRSKKHFKESLRIADKMINRIFDTPCELQDIDCKYCELRKVCDKHKKSDTPK